MDTVFFRSAGMVACALLALTGCGGGGGSGGGGGQPSMPLTLSIVQNPITATVAQMDLPSQVTVTATVQGTTSATPLYVVIADPSGTFSGVATTVSQTASNTYQTSLPLPDTLSIGTRTGTLTVSVCSDPQCNNTLGRTTAPYSVTITENPTLTGSWSPSTLSVMTVEGDREVTWPVAFASPQIAMILFARVTDTAGVVNLARYEQTFPTATALNEVTLKIATGLAAGTYTGNVDLTFCRDQECRKAYRGVTRLPYTVTVAPMTNLKPLAPLAGATDWTTVQGNSAHTGYVPVTLNPADFSPRWLWLTPDRTAFPELLDVVAADGKVFTIKSPGATIHDIPVLVALDEQTGTVSWQQSLPDTEGNGEASVYGLGPLTPPAIEGGHVYVVRSVNTRPPQEGQFSAFQVSDGAPRFAPTEFPELATTFYDYIYERPRIFISEQPGYLTPGNGAMLLAGSGPGAVARSFVSLDTSSGARTNLWNSCPAVYDGPLTAGAVAIDSNGDTLVVTDSGLVLADTCETISSSTAVHYGSGPAVFPGTSDVVAVGGGSVVVFDTAARQVKWSVAVSDNDVFAGSPAIAGNTLYVQNSGRMQLEARNMQDGQVLWTWTPGLRDEAGFIGNVLATQNIVFVSTRNRVYAIDTTTRQTVWIYPYGGSLSLSENGVLHVRRKLGPSNITEALAAINLH